MPTMEELNALLERRQATAVNGAPAPQRVDFGDLVVVLQDIAGRLEQPETDDEHTKALIRQLKVGVNVIEKALAALPDALAALQIPAPVVNVEAPQVTVTQPAPFKVAYINRNDAGQMVSVSFDDEPAPAQADDGIEIE